MQAGCKAHEHPVLEPWGPSSPVTPVTEASEGKNLGYAKKSRHEGYPTR